MADSAIFERPQLVNYPQSVRSLLDAEGEAGEPGGTPGPVVAIRPPSVLRRHVDAFERRLDFPPSGTVPASAEDELSEVIGGRQGLRRVMDLVQCSRRPMSPSW